MSNTSWVEIAVRLLDYCQTRDAFLRAQEVSPEMIQMWAEELSKTRQTEADLQEATASAYRKAGGKPPADPLGAIVAEARSMRRDRQALRPAEGLSALPSSQGSGAPVRSAYQVDNAISFSCLNHPSLKGGIHRGCGAQPGEFCVTADKRPAKIPHTARLLHAEDALSPTQLQLRRSESPTFRKARQ